MVIVDVRTLLKRWRTTQLPFFTPAALKPAINFFTLVSTSAALKSPGVVLGIKVQFLMSISSISLGDENDVVLAPLSCHSSSGYRRCMSKGRQLVLIEESDQTSLARIADPL